MPIAYIIPLASRGFVPTDQITNPVRYHLEDETGKLLPGSYATVEDAKLSAKAKGLELPAESE